MVYSEKSLKAGREALEVATQWLARHPNADLRWVPGTVIPDSEDSHALVRAVELSSPGMSGGGLAAVLVDALSPKLGSADQ